MFKFSFLLLLNYRDFQPQAGSSPFVVTHAPLLGICDLSRGEIRTRDFGVRAMDVNHYAGVHPLLKFSEN